MVQQTQQPSTNRYVVNQALSKMPGVGWIPVNQVFYWVAIWVLVLVLQKLLSTTPLHFTFQNACFIATILCLSYWALTGAKEHQYLDSFRALAFLQPTWIRAKVKIKWTRVGLPTKEKVGKIGNEWKRLWSKHEDVLVPIEDCSDLVCYGQIDRQGYSVGFYLLEPLQGQFRFVFRWRVKGPHPVITEEVARETLEEYWEKGVEGFSFQEDITIEQSSFTDDKDRQAELDGLLDGNDNELAQALIYSQKARTRQISKQGLRKVKKTLIAATYTPGHIDSEDKNYISRILRGIFEITQKLWETFTGRKEEMNHRRLEKLVIRAFTKGFLGYHSLFTNTMRLEVQPLTAFESWQEDYAEHHKQPAPPIPQLLVLDEQGMRVKVDEDQLHASTVLFQAERGEPSVPRRNPEWVYLPIHKQYVGLMELGRPKNYLNARNQIRYHWNILERESVYNCRIVSRFTVGNRAMDKFNLERSTVNSTEVAERAMQRRTVDVTAMKNAKQSVAAREALDEGDNVVHVASGIFLYRNNPQTLDQDFAKLADWLPGGAPERERNIVPRLWMQRLPYVNEAFLNLPTDRSQKYLSRHAAGLLNLTSTRSIDPKGLEFVALDGGSPICIDAFDPSRHYRWMIVAKPRSGKSIVTGGYVEMAWLHQQPIVAFDVPRADGKSTYSDLVEAIKQCGGKAEYFDIGSKSNNLLHWYDFSNMPDAEYRQQSMQDLRINGTVAVGMGSIHDPSLAEAMNDIVTQSLAAFDAEPQIRALFAAANKAGVGTSDWRKSPTYHHYLAFLTPWLEQYFKENETTLPTHYRDAAGILVQKLRTIIHSRLGKAIAQPSDFDNKLDLLVFALTGERSDYEMKLMALAGYGALLNRALTTEVCHFLVDESPQLFPHPAFAARVGGLATNGAKWGVRLGIISQFPEVVFNSVAGPDIKQTLNTILIGNIEEQVISTLSGALNFRADLLSRCAHASFAPSSSTLRSHWLLKVAGNYTYCGYYPSDLLLALTANDLPEAAARKRVLSYYPEAQVRGNLEFSRLYTAARRAGIPMSQIHSERANSDHTRVAA